MRQTAPCLTKIDMEFWDVCDIKHRLWIMIFKIEINGLKSNETHFFFSEMKSMTKIDIKILQVSRYQQQNGRNKRQ